MNRTLIIGLIAIGCTATIAAAVLIGLFIGHNQSASNPNITIAQPTANPTPYQFGYMSAKCQQGITNYSALTPQVKSQMDEIGKEGFTARDQLDSAGVTLAESRLNSLAKSVTEIQNRISKLNTCIQSVNQQQQFTPTELEELNSYIDTSTEIPIVN